MTNPAGATWHPDPQRYAVQQERLRHEQALSLYGEYAVFVLLWRSDDEAKGLVDRCSNCYESYGKIAEAYGQPSMKDCPNCFGTSFEGGYKARLVRPSLWDYNEPSQRDHIRGETQTASASIQTTADFSLRNGDFIFRADGSRWQMMQAGTNHLRTGFEPPNIPRTALGFNYGQAMLEDPAAVSYMIPPSAAALAEILDVSRIRYPLDFSDVEVIRGPLM